MSNKRSKLHVLTARLISDEKLPIGTPVKLISHDRGLNVPTVDIASLGDPIFGHTVNNKKTSLGLIEVDQYPPFEKIKYVE